MHEGKLLYGKFHGFWIRKQVAPQDRPTSLRDTSYFWEDFERWSPDVKYLMRDIGIQPGKP